ncbi:MAG: hypothetical protein WBE76_24905 [Terracidiphilus sp.]
MTQQAPFDPCNLPLSAVSGSDGPPQKADAIREAYKRHTAELVTIDEQQGKLLLVMLGIFSAGATLLVSGKENPMFRAMPMVQWGLTIITGSLLFVWIWFTWERYGYRQAVRHLLVRCELALGFYTKGAYLQGDALYKSRELEFFTKGSFMPWVHVIIVVLAAVGFLLVLWSPQPSCNLAPQPERHSGSQSFCGIHSANKSTYQDARCPRLPSAEADGTWETTEVNHRQNIQAACFPAGCSTCPPNWKRIAESSLSSYSASPRELKR